MEADVPGGNIPEPIFDPAQLQEISGGDSEFEREITSEYLVQAQGLITGIAHGLEGGDVAEIGRLAHTLKGSSRTIGAEAVATVCAELERAAGTGDLSPAAGMLARAERALGETRGRLADYFDSGATRRAG